MADPAADKAVNGSGVFTISRAELSAINEHKDSDGVAKNGGLPGLAAALRTDLNHGIHTKGQGDVSVEARAEAFGANKYKAVPSKNFFSLLWEQLKDPTLMLLMAAALVSTVLGAAVPEERENSAWTEGVAIWVAVGVVSLVGAGNDFQKDLQFRKLNEQKDTIEVKVLRDGVDTVIINTELVVGDILVLDTGDKVAADGLVIEAHTLVIDEASLTGEADPMKKDAVKTPWVRSGTQVTEGSGKILVLAVGEDSEWGRTMSMVVGETPDTPLQENLAHLAGSIGKLGLTVGVICFIVLMIRWMIENKGFPASKIASGPLQFFIFAVTIVVVAVPEGLPLAVTISLAFSMRKMMKDRCFVRVLAACETMGGATAIASDKTGTLTENRMTVVEGWFAGKRYVKEVPKLESLNETVANHIRLNIALNSKAFLVEQEDGAVDFVGNRTECALLMLQRTWGESYAAIREKHHHEVTHIYGFSSEKKMASVLISSPTGPRLYNKGAAEIVLRKCTTYLDQAGNVQPMSAEMSASMEDMITEMASTGLRTLCLTYADIPANADIDTEQAPDVDLTACCIVGIKDPVRKEVPDAVATCVSAGIVVRMVTGDNIHTAQHIARECGILTEGGIAMEGPEFRKMSDEQILPILPNLQVLARSSPADKYHLVQLLHKLGDVVAVTGDGTNDAPALKESDVGLAMGIAGTEVAKEAADIVILDDNFRSIVKAVLWGRAVFNNIRKFLQFQLTVNLGALIVAFVAAVGSGETPLTVLQLLWVNLIMDSLAALALATEDPTPELLNQKPHGRTEPLISKRMYKHIVVQSLYQVFWIFLILYGLPNTFDAYAKPNECIGIDNEEFRSFSYVEWWHYKQLINLNAFQLESALANNTNGYGALISTDAKGGLCCEKGRTCLRSQGGIYDKEEEILCEWNGPSALAAKKRCNLREPRVEYFCDRDANGRVQSCPKYDVYSRLYDQAHKQFEHAEEDARFETNSLIFNAFIFCQIFNMFNARKINDEYNLLQDIWKSHIFFYVFFIIVGAQVIIVQLLGSFFDVKNQDWGEWLVAIAIGSGAIPVSLLTRFITRLFEGRALINKRVDD